MDDLLHFRAVTKLRSFFEKMDATRLHPLFDVLKATGRTSSFGALNSQNLPRDDRVRSCFVAGPDWVLVVADYAAIEMATLAQAMLTQFRTPSRMAEAINSGSDLHLKVAALALGTTEESVSKDDRQKAKPINFGKPGAMGSEGLRDHARTGYGLELSLEEVKRLEEAWLRLFPEMRTFLAQDVCPGVLAASFFGVTAASYARATGRCWPLPRTGRASRSNQETLGMLGSMLLKVARDPVPTTGTGRPYSPEDRDYFWERIASRSDALPPNLRHQVPRRAPSRDLHRAILATAGRGPVFTLTGRLRASATYAAGTTRSSRAWPATARSWHSGSSGVPDTGSSISFMTRSSSKYLQTPIWTGWSRRFRS